MLRNEESGAVELPVSKNARSGRPSYYPDSRNIYVQSLPPGVVRGSAAVAAAGKA